MNQRGQTKQLIILITILSILFLGATGCEISSAQALQQVWAGDNTDFTTGDISADGRYLSDIDWGSGDLQLINLMTGDSLDVTNKGYGAGQYAWSSAFSRDGQRLAVSFYIYQAGSHELRVMNLDGTASRVLVPARKNITYIDPVDWSPLDKQILVALQRQDLTWQIGLVSVDDGSMNILKTLSWLAPGGEQTYPNAYLSPDGRYVAYDYRPKMEEHTRNIYALSVDGNHETKLVSGPGVDRLLGWIPNGHGILFYSNRSGRSAIWQLQVQNGRSTGEPELIRSDVQGLIPLGFTKGGYAYGMTIESTQLHTGVMNQKTGRFLVTPKPVDDPPMRGSLAGDWSPDGGRLAYVTHDPFPTATETLVIRSADGELIREIPLSPTIHTSTGTLKWIGEEIIILFAVEKGRNGIYRMDPRDGSFTRLPITGEGLNGANLKWFEVGPEGEQVYLFRPAENASGAYDLVAVNTGSGDLREIGTYSSNHRTLAISPDGEELAFVTHKNGDGPFELWVIPVSGEGVARVLHRASNGPPLTSPLTWSTDGSRLLFAQPSEEDGRVLWSVAADGSKGPVRRGGGDWCCRGHDIRLHPDGRRFMVPAGNPRAKIWILDGY